MIRAKNCGSIQIHCCLNVSDRKAKIMCNDPKCDGRVVSVGEDWEIACHRSDGLPHPIGLPRSTEEPTRSIRPVAHRPVKRTLWQRLLNVLRLGGADV